MAGKSLTTKTEKKLNSLVGPQSFWDPNVKYEQILNTIQSSNEGLFALDKNSHFSYINQSASKLLGLRGEKILGRPFSILKPREEFLSLEKVYQDGLKSQTVQIFEDFFPKLKAWILIHIYPTKQGTTFYFQDISSQKKVASALAQTSSQLKLLLQNIHDGIFQIDNKGKIIYGNEAAAKMLGFKNNSELLKHNLYKILASFELFNEDGQSLPVQRLPSIRVFKNEPSIQELIGIKKSKSDHIHWIVVKTNLITLNRYQPPQAVVIYDEITDRVERDQNRELLFGGVSHDLRNLLTLTKAYVQILKKKLESTARAESIDLLLKIDQQISQLSHLTTDFIELIRFRSDKIKLEIRLSDLSKLVAETAQEIQILTPVPKIVLKIQTNRKISVDPRRLKQVLVNLLDNAIKYSPLKKQVWVIVKAKPKYFSIAVKDFGKGIAKKDLVRIFDPFKRVSWEHKDVSGVGLGLYISSEIIRLHGGKIVVKSRLSKGSTFEILLPYN